MFTKVSHHSNNYLLVRYFNKIYRLDIYLKLTSVYLLFLLTFYLIAPHRKLYYYYFIYCPLEFYYL